MARTKFHTTELQLVDKMGTLIAVNRITFYLLLYCFHEGFELFIIKHSYLNNVNFNVMLVHEDLVNVP